MCQGQRINGDIPITDFDVVNNAKPTIFSKAVFILRRLLINKGTTSLHWVLLLNAIFWCKQLRSKSNAPY